MFRKILVPLDFTEKNESALDLAMRLVSQDKTAEVVLLHVIEKVEHLSEEELKTFYERLEAAAREKIDDAGAAFRRHKIKTQEEVTYGRRAEEIVRVAQNNSVNLIVMGSHKVEPGSGWGSVSYQVAILAPCAVLLLK